LIVAVEHGPQMHAAALIILAAVAVVGGVVYAGRRRLAKGLGRLNREPANDRSAERSDRGGEE
jgi:hypothetical protein